MKAEQAVAVAKEMLSEIRASMPKSHRIDLHGHAVTFDITPDELHVVRLLDALGWGMKIRMSRGLEHVYLYAQLQARLPFMRKTDPSDLSKGFASNPETFPVISAIDARDEDIRRGATTFRVTKRAIRALVALDPKCKPEAARKLLRPLFRDLWQIYRQGHDKYVPDSYDVAKQASDLRWDRVFADSDGKAELAGHYCYFPTTTGGRYLGRSVGGEYFRSAKYAETLDWLQSKFKQSEAAGAASQ